METNEQTITECYNQYYQTHSVNRNDLFNNPEVLFQTFAFDASIIRALRSTNLDPRQTLVLDVGCGSGASILNFLRLGFNPINLQGIDIQAHRVQEAMTRYPNIHFFVGDAAVTKFDDQTYDIVFESAMFLQMTDSDLAKRIAAEMIRITKSGRFIILTDWRYGKPGNPNFNAVNRRRITQLFRVGDATEFHSEHKGALIPPVGRFLSRYAAWAYFLVSAICPPLVGQVTTVLRKK